MILSLDQFMAARRLVRFVWLLSLLGCNQGEASSSVPLFSRCQPGGATAFSDPQAVFAAYADALNSGDFCRAIGLFDAQDRVDVGLTAFRALVIAAGGKSPAQEQYRAGVSEICEHFDLGFKDRSEFSGLFLALLNDDDWKSDLEPVERVAAKDPASFYVDVMHRLRRPQPNMLPTLKRELSGIEFNAETARASATRGADEVVSVSFKQSPSGWRLSSPL